MICKFSFVNYKYPKNQTSQLFTPIAELLRRLESGTMKPEDFKENPSSTEFDSTDKVDFTTDGSAHVDKFDVAAAKFIIPNGSAEREPGEDGGQKDPPSSPGSDPSADPSSE